MERLDAVVARSAKDGKTYWTKIGAAFPNKDGKGWTVILDALPLTGEGGQARISLFPPKDRDGGRGDDF